MQLQPQPPSLPLPFRNLAATSGSLAELAQLSLLQLEAAMMGDAARVEALAVAAEGPAEAAQDWEGGAAGGSAGGVPGTALGSGSTRERARILFEFLHAACPTST